MTMSDTNPAPAYDDEDDTLSLVQRFPVLLLGGITLLLTTIMSALVEFGVPLDEGKQAAISRCVEAAGGIVLLVLLYRRVVSKAKVVSRVDNAGRVIAGEASTAPTGTELITAADALGRPVPLAAVKPGLVATLKTDLPYKPLLPEPDNRAVPTAGRGPLVADVAAPNPDQLREACRRFHPGEPCIPGRNHPARNT